MKRQQQLTHRVSQSQPPIIHAFRDNPFHQDSLFPIPPYRYHPCVLLLLLLRQIHMIFHTTKRMNEGTVHLDRHLHSRRHLRRNTRASKFSTVYLTTQLYTSSIPYHGRGRQNPDNE
eukprot:75819_1